MKRLPDGYSPDTMSIIDALRLVSLPSLGRARIKAEALAARCGIPFGTFSNKLNGYAEITADDVVSVTRESGDDLLIQVIALMCGGDFHRRESGRPHSAKDLISAIQREIIEHADVHRAIIGAIEDGQITDAEMRIIHREISEQQAAIARLVELLGSMLSEGGNPCKS